MPLNTKVLLELGLTKNEIKVYLELLRLGTTNAGPLITNLGMHRASVYDIIEMLIEKGLASFVIKSNTKYFHATNPERLFEYLESKKGELDDKKLDLKKLISELDNIIGKDIETQEGTIYKGKKGLKSIFEDILKEKKTWRNMGGTGKFKELFPIYYHQFHKKRQKLKILMKIMYHESLRISKREKSLKQIEIKYLPKQYLPPASISIYGDKTVIFIWSEDPMAFLIKSKKVADSYNSFFKLLWGIAKK